MSTDWKLCLVADTMAAGDRNLVSLTYEAVTAGVTLVQLRAKNLKSSDFFQLASEFSQLLSSRNIPLIINDRVDIALASGAEGVHLGLEDLPLSEARCILGENRIIGISASTIAEALEAQAKGADYLGVGPIYPTDSKTNPGPILGLKGLEAIRKCVELPILAIGGVNPANAQAVIAAGADGIAVISAILGTSDITQATRDLLAAMG